MVRERTIVAVAFVGVLFGGCSKSNSSKPAEAPRQVGKILAYAEDGMSGCDHDLTVSARAEHAWPHPAESRNVRWGDEYALVRLRLNPRSASFFTATVKWKEGELIEVEDSEVSIRKPRQVVAKHDMFVTRKEWEQGVEVSRRVKAVTAGDVASFLFYNSRGLCLIQTDQGPAWTRCNLGESFEGVTAEQPFACEQVWWIKVAKSRVDKGWVPFDEDLMDRVPPAQDAAR